MNPGKGLGQSPTTNRRIGTGYQMQNNLTIRCRLENRSRRLQLIPQFSRIHQITIMSDRNLPTSRLNRQRLCIFDRARACC